MRVLRLALLLAAAPACLLTAAPGAAAAQDGPLSNTTDPSKAAPPPPSASKPIAAPERGGPSAEDTTPRFTLAGAEFDGATTLTQDALRPAWTPYAGKAVSLADLHAIARAAEKIYARAGYPYVAIVVTAQKVEGGIVHFKVIEGRVTSVTVLSNDPVARRQTAAAFGDLVGHTPLSAADVEGAYNRAKDIPGLAIDGALRRGSVPGGMDLVVRAKHQDWRVYANTNNYYADSVGPWGALLGIDHFGSSAYGDQTSLQLYSSIDGGQQQVARLSHRQTINASGTTLAGMVLVAKAKPAGAVAPLDLATNVTAGRVSVSQPLIDRLRFSLDGTLGFEASDQETKVFSVIGLTHDKLRIFTLAFGGDAVWLGGSKFNYSLELRQGVDGLGSSREGDAHLSRAGANPQAFVARGSVDALTPPMHGFALYGRVEGQAAGAPLTAPEQYAIGNLSIGRGYAPGAAFGDSAIAAAVEARMGPYMVKGVRVQPFVFYDAAQLWTLSPGAHRDHSISSWGGGLRLEVPGKVHMDLTYAAPLDPALGLGDPTPHPRLMLSLTVGLDQVFKGRRSGESQ